MHRNSLINQVLKEDHNLKELVQNNSGQKEKYTLKESFQEGRLFVGNMLGSKKMKIAREILLSSNNQYAITNASCLGIDLYDNEASKALSEITKSKGYQAMHIIEEENILKIYLAKSNSIDRYQWSESCMKPVIQLDYWLESSIIKFMDGYSIEDIGPNSLPIKKHYLVTAHIGAELKLWDLNNHTIVSSHVLKNCEIESIVILHDSFLIVVYSNRKIAVFDLQFKDFRLLTSQNLQINEDSNFKEIHVFIPDKNQNNVKIIVLSTDGVFYVYHLIFSKESNKKNYVEFELLYKNISEEKDLNNIGNMTSSMNYPESIFYSVNNKVIQANIYTMKIENQSLHLGDENDYIQYMLLIDLKNLAMETTHILCLNRIDSIMRHLMIENDKIITITETEKMKIYLNDIAPKVQLAVINKGIDNQEMKLFTLCQQNSYESSNYVKVVNLRLYD